MERHKDILEKEDDESFESGSMLNNSEEKEEVDENVQGEEKHVPFDSDEEA